MTSSRSRTTSSRKRAGSRKGNGGRTFVTDCLNRLYDFSWNTKPNHASRAVSIDTLTKALKK